MKRNKKTILVPIFSDYKTWKKIFPKKAKKSYDEFYNPHGRARDYIYNAVRNVSKAKENDEYKYIKLVVINSEAYEQIQLMNGQTGNITLGDITNYARNYDSNKIIEDVRKSDIYNIDIGCIVFDGSHAEEMINYFNLDDKAELETALASHIKADKVYVPGYVFPFEYVKSMGDKLIRILQKEVKPSMNGKEYVPTIDVDSIEPGNSQIYVIPFAIKHEFKSSLIKANEVFVPDLEPLGNSRDSNKIISRIGEAMQGSIKVLTHMLSMEYLAVLDDESVIMNAFSRGGDNEEQSDDSCLGSACGMIHRLEEIGGIFDKEDEHGFVRIAAAIKTIINSPSDHPSLGEVMETTQEMIADLESYETHERIMEIIEAILSDNGLSSYIKGK